MINKFKLFSVCFILTMMAGGHAFGQDVVVTTVTTTPTPPAEPLSKKGYPILPKGGDFGLGFDAIPFFQFAGNAFNGSGGNGLNTNYPNSQLATQQIMGKYFLGTPDQSYASLTAIRARFRVQNGNNYYRNRVGQDNVAVPDPSAQVTDELKVRGLTVDLGVGIEKRRGSGRLYGIYGAELTLRYFSNSTDAEYGNEFSSSNQTPTSTTNFPSYGTAFSGVGAGERGVSINGNKSFGIGARAFVGVEYFFAPRMSLSGEFGYGFLYQKAVKGSTDYQGWNAQTSTTYTRTAINPGQRSFNLDTDNLDGSINLFFYF